MPGFKANVKHLRTFATMAPRANQDKIRNIARLYEEKRIPNYQTAARIAFQLSVPSSVKRGQADRDYDAAVSKYSLAVPITGRLKREHETLRARRARVQDFDLDVVLYAAEGDRAPHGQLTEDEKERYKKYLKKRFKGMRPFWKGQLTVTGSAATGDFLALVNNQLVKRGSRDWRELVSLCRTNATFADRDRVVPGYTEGIYIISHVPSPEGEGVSPLRVAHRAGDKIMIQYMYCSNQLDLTRSTFREAIMQERYVKYECFLNAIYDTYRDTLLSPNKKRYVITRQIILDLLHRTEETIKEGLTVEDVLPFFQKYKLKLRVFDKFYKLIFKYDPEVPNFNQHPMYCMTDGNHIYVLNHDLDKLAQKLDDDEEEYRVYASPDYRVDEEKEAARYRMIESVDDILLILRTAEEDEVSELVYLVHKYDDLEEMLWQMRDAGYTPQPKYQAGKISHLVMTFNKTTFILKGQQLAPTGIDGTVEVAQEDTYNRMNEAMTAFNNRLFRLEHKSFYTQEDVDILDEYRTFANVGWLRPRPKGLRDLVEIDRNKAFTAAFSEITQIPIFNEFDNFRAYQGEAIEDLTLYVVRAEKHDLFFNRRYNLSYGIFIKLFTGGQLLTGQRPASEDAHSMGNSTFKETDNIRIMACKRPSFIKKVDYRQIAEELFNTAISPDPEEDKVIKKMIANTNFGMLEKGINRNQKSYLFDAYSQCKYYQSRYGGAINSLKRYREVKTTEPSCLDADLEDEEPGERTEYVETGEVLYILNLTASAGMTNGFRYIKELLLQHHNYFMQEALDKLTAEGIPAYTVKTDALTVHASFLERCQELLDFQPGLGKWRVSKKGEEIIFPHEHVELKENREMTISVVSSELIPLTIQEEYDADMICQIFKERRRVMIRAEFAGCGKSYCCRRMQDLGHRVLFVCPTNKLATNYGADGCTLNKFFSIGMTEETKMARFDDSSYDVVVFDEIFFASIRKLARIKRYCDEHPEKIVLATGDTNQLETIDQLTNQLDYDQYYNHCIDTIFPYRLYFQENKRLKTIEDKLVLKQFKEDNFNLAFPMKITIQRYFRMTDRITTTYNIAYRNSTCQWVNRQVRQMLGKRGNYEVGEILVCRKYFKLKKFTFNVNYEYAITSLTSTTLTLDDTHVVPLAAVAKCFAHNYCRTCHSFQGSSIDGEITIFDWQFPRVDRKWIYTSVTRATELKNVAFYQRDDVTADREYYYLDRYLKKKIDGYKQQDTKAGRRVGEASYVFVGWLRDCIGKSCNSCGDCLTYEYDDEKRTITSNLTAQRIDNSLPHTMDNIVPYCTFCNCSLGKRE